MSYIVKNCPAYEYDEEWDHHICKRNLAVYETTCDTCPECSDCTTKQIIEMCRHSKKHSDCGRDCSSFGLFLSKLLSKLDIQEVN